MASNELSRRAVPEPPLFRVALSREQQSALANFLPRCYSFQPLKLARVGEEEAVRA